MIQKPKYWWDKTFNVRGALGGGLIGVSIGVVPAVLLGGLSLWWFFIAAWVSSALLGIILGLVFIKPKYPNTLAAAKDAITYKQFGFYVFVLIALYTVSILLDMSLDKKTAYGYTIVLGIILIAINTYIRNDSKK